MLYEPTSEHRSLVEFMSAAGIATKSKLSMLNSYLPDDERIGYAEMRKIFGDELDNGETRATLKVASALYKMATSGNHDSVTLKAAQTWLYNRAGWHRLNIKHTDEHGVPVVENAFELLQSKINRATGTEGAKVVPLHPQR